MHERQNKKVFNDVVYMTVNGSEEMRIKIQASCDHLDMNSFKKTGTKIEAKEKEIKLKVQQTIHNDRAR